MKRFLFLVFFVTILFNISLFSSINTYRHQSLLVSSSVKGNQMGDAYTSVTSSMDSVIYNPAILGYLQDMNLAFNYNGLGFGINYISIDASLSVFSNAGFYAGYSYISYGDFEYTAKVGDDIITKTMNYDIGDSVIQTGLGVKIFKKFYGGTTIKFAKEKFIDSSYNDIFQDIGFLYILPGINLSAVFYNSIPLSKNNLPFQICVGASSYFTVFDKSDLLLSTDIKYITDAGANFSIGSELNIDSFFIRLGYNSFDDLNHFRFGVGALISMFDINFTVIENTLSESIYKVGINVKFK